MVVKRWWMTGAVDRAKKHYNIVVFDRGISIPAALPASKYYPWIKRGIKLLSGSETDESLDGARIRLAMTAPRSSTGFSHRGKGFPAFKDVVDVCKRGRLRILSRRGEFFYESGQKLRERAVDTPLNGTLVEWDLWL